LISFSFRGKIITDISEIESINRYKALS